MSIRKRYSPEVKERAVRMVFEHTSEHGSQWAAILSIAEFNILRDLWHESTR